jgi:hypothetical protein
MNATPTPALSLPMIGIGCYLPCPIALVLPVLAVDNVHPHTNKKATEEIHLTLFGGVKQSATGLTGGSRQ